MRRRLPLIKPLAVLGALFAATVVIVAFALRFDRVVVARGTFAGGSVAVRAPMSGRVLRVAVRPGDRVTAGQVLVEFDGAALAADLELTRIRSRHLQDRLDDLELEIASQRDGIQPGELDQARRAVERSRVELQEAERRHQRQVALAGEGLVADEDLQNSVSDLKLAELDLEEQTSALPLLERRQTATVAELRRDLAEITGDRAEAERERVELERRLGLCTVKAPVAGVVTGTSLFELADQHVDDGQELLRVQQGAAVRFEANLDDRGRTKVRPGQTARIRVDGYPWILHGAVPARVVTVGGHNGGQEGGAGFTVVMAFDPEPKPGPPLDGMTGQARITVGERMSLGRLLVEHVLGRGTP